MTNTQENDYSAWSGHELVDTEGGKVGKIGQIYLDDHTGQPSWVTVHTGMFGKKSSFVPIEGTVSDGDRLVSAWDKDKVQGAPQVEDDGDGYLTPDEERQLYKYYGKDYDTTPARQEAPERDRRQGQGRDTSGPNTDDAMTRSEEEVTVGKATRESGRARLRKYIVTEEISQTVPVSHEEVTVVREPITDANRDAAMSGGELTEEEHEIVLHEERPVVGKDVVAKERVRLGTETVTGEEQVDETVRKERIEQESGPRRDER